MMSYFQAEEPSNVPLIIFSIVILLLVALLVAAFWRLFSKAGRPGWASLIPIYNIVVLLGMIGRPWWYLIWAVIPGANIVLLVILIFGLVRSFGRGVFFALATILLPFIMIPMLAFGKSRYIGPMGPSYRRGPQLPKV